jgi:hypothetical protein
MKAEGVGEETFDASLLKGFVLLAEWSLSWCLFDEPSTLCRSNDAYVDNRLPALIQKKMM